MIKLPLVLHDLIIIFIGGLVRRTCGSDKVWLDVDFSACTLSDRNISFVLIWIPVNITVARVQNMTNTILNDVRNYFIYYNSL